MPISIANYIMTYKPTILNISTAIFLTGILIYSIWNYNVLAAGEGWGIVAMFGLAAIGLLASLLDILLQRFIKNQLMINLLGLLILISAVIAILSAT
jgi:hypothetical protein